MSINSVSKRSSSVAQEDLTIKPPLTGFFKSLAPPRGDESMVDVCASVIADARAGLNGMDADELTSACEMCDEHGRDVKQFQETQPGAVVSKLTPSLVASIALYTLELSCESPYGVCNAALRCAERAKCKPFVPFIWHVMHKIKNFSHTRCSLCLFKLKYCRSWKPCAQISVKVVNIIAHCMVWMRIFLFKYMNRVN